LCRHLSRVREKAARAITSAGPCRRRRLRRNALVGLSIHLWSAGRNADRHLGPLCHHPWLGPPEHPERRVFRRRAQSRPPNVLGDWIVLSDGTEGRVVETNWRSTQLLTLTHNVVTLPNSF